jgi:hypothetical protein
MSRTSAGTPSTRQMATRCNSPPDKLDISFLLQHNGWAYVWTSWSIIGSICMGLMTSELNWGSVYQHRPAPTGRQHTHEHGLDPLEQEMPDGTWEFGGDWISASCP